MEVIHFEEQTFTSEQLSSWINNLYIVEPNPEIGAPLLEIMSIVNNVLNHIEESSNNTII